MPTTNHAAPNAALVRMVEEFLEDSGQSARWLGWQVAKDYRLVPNLKRGQAYPAAVLYRLSMRLHAFYSDLLLDEKEVFFDPIVVRCSKPNDLQLAA